MRETESETNKMKRCIQGGIRSQSAEVSSLATKQAALIRTAQMRTKGLLAIPSSFISKIRAKDKMKHMYLSTR